MSRPSPAPPRPDLPPADPAAGGPGAGNVWLARPAGITGSRLAWRVAVFCVAMPAAAGWLVAAGWPAQVSGRQWMVVAAVTVTLALLHLRTRRVAMDVRFDPDDGILVGGMLAAPWPLIATAVAVVLLFRPLQRPIWYRRPATVSVTAAAVWFAHTTGTAAAGLLGSQPGQPAVTLLSAVTAVVTLNLFTYLVPVAVLWADTGRRLPLAVSGGDRPAGGRYLTIAGLVSVRYLATAALWAAAAGYLATLSAAWALVAFASFPLVADLFGAVGVRTNAELAHARQVATDRQQLLRTMLIEVNRRSGELLAAIHDGPLQQILAARSAAEEAIWVGVPDDVAADLTDLRDALGAAVDQTRDILRNRGAPLHGEVTLRDALEQTRAEISGRFPAGIRLDVADLPELADERSGLLFLLLREAMVNAAKHSRASRLHVHVRRCPHTGDVVADVTDDGTGFPDQPPAASDGHLGVPLMIERAAALGGSLQIEPADPGTRVTVRLPAGR